MKRNPKNPFSRKNTDSGLPERMPLAPMTLGVSRRSVLARNIIGVSILIIIIIIVLGLVQSANAFSGAIHQFSSSPSYNEAYPPPDYTESTSVYRWSDKYGLWFEAGEIRRYRPIRAPKQFAPGAYRKHAPFRALERRSWE